MALALVLLPSMLGIMVFSVVHFAGESPPPASPAAERPATTASPPIATEAPMAAPGSAPASLPASAPAPARNVIESGTSEPEDIEERSVVPTTMLADNGPAPSFGGEAYGSSPRFRSAYLGRSSGVGGGGGFGGVGGGAAGGSGSGEGPGDAEDHIERLPTDNDSTGGRVQSEPTLPEPDLGTPGETSQPEGPSGDIVVPGGDAPSDPLTTIPNEWIAPIGGTGGDSDEKEAKPNVSVPEPSTWGLFAIGLLGAAMSARRRSRAA